MRVLRKLIVLEVLLLVWSADLSAQEVTEIEALEDVMVSRDIFADGPIEFRGIDGTGNNRHQILRTRGAVGTRYRRLTPVEYEDGVQAPGGVIPAGGTRKPIRLHSEEEIRRLEANPPPGSSIVRPEPGVTLLQHPPERPSARTISNRVHDQHGKHVPNDRSMTDMIWSFGQFVNHDTDLAEDGTRDPRFLKGARVIDFPIPIPEDDPSFGVFGVHPQDERILPFKRDAFAPETGTIHTGVPGLAINTVTAWLDLSTVYGSDPDFTAQLREDPHAGTNGKLRVHPSKGGDLLPLDTKRQMRCCGQFRDVGFLAGDRRGNENNSLVSQHVLWMRNHNRLAAKIEQAHRDWSDERVFQRARQINIAYYQNIVLYEWLPALVGEHYIGLYSGYDSTRDPQTSDIFAVVILRIGHTLVSPTIKRIDAQGKSLGDIAFIDNFGAPDILTGKDVEPILRGLSRGLAQEFDPLIVDDLRNGLPNFTATGGAVAFDLAAVNIQRARDRGISDYSTGRRTLSLLAPHLGVRPVVSFAEITSDPAMQALLRELYFTVEDIDPWVGLVAEDRVPGTSVGPTTRAVFKLQYEAFRDGDRFWFENAIGEAGGESGFFTPAEIEVIKKVRLSDVIRMNTGITDIQDNVFFYSGGSVGSSR